MELQPMGAPSIALHLHHHRSERQESMTVAHVAGAYREFAGLDPVAETKGLQVGRSTCQLFTAIRRIGRSTSFWLNCRPSSHW